MKRSTGHAWGGMMKELARIARQGPEGGHVDRTWTHTMLEDRGYIELRNNWARVTGEGLDALAGRQ